MSSRVDQSESDQLVDAEVIKIETQAAMDTLDELQAQFEAVSVVI